MMFSGSGYYNGEGFFIDPVLILVLMDDVLRLVIVIYYRHKQKHVLILVLMDDVFRQM